MGQDFSQPDQPPTLDDFKEQVLGTLVFILAPDFDPKLEFKSESDSEIDAELESEVNLLPMIRGDFKEELRNYYLNNRDVIDEYIQNNIINTRDNAQTFHELLLKNLLNAKVKGRGNSSSISNSNSNSNSNSKVESSISDVDTYAETEQREIPKHLRP